MRLLDLINSIPLIEMAHKKRDIINRIRSFQDEIFDHLIKIVACNDQTPRNHWCVEINAWIGKLSKMESKSTNLSEKEWYNYLWDEPAGHGEQSVTKSKYWLNLDKDDPFIWNSLSDEIIWLQMQEVYVKLCYDLGKRKFKNIKDYI